MGSGNKPTTLVAAITPRDSLAGSGAAFAAWSERAEVLGYGASAVIVGSSLFADGRVDVTFARELAEAVGPDRVIAAVDSRAGQVVIKGWREAVPLSAVEAVGALEPFCGEFLYTHVDNEGLMSGTDLDAIMAVRHATQRRLTAAGGITTQEEIDTLDAAGIDAVVGMALYTGRLDIPPPRDVADSP